MTNRETKYWIIKCRGGYWLEAGGVTPRQSKAERFATRENAQADLQKWLHPDETAWIVRIVRREKGHHAREDHFLRA